MGLRDISNEGLFLLPKLFRVYCTWTERTLKNIQVLVYLPISILIGVSPAIRRAMEDM